ncbi:MAG: DUF882 domain-containing protein [Beijerinckiaceae bacterium]
MRRSVPTRLKAAAYRFGHLGLLLSGVMTVSAIGIRPTQDVVAQGGTRTLTIYHAHTKEQETITYKRSGSFDSAGLQKLNWLLRDWRVDEPTRMDPVLFDILWEAHRASGSSAAIHVVSAYRSPGTNAMLRRRSRGVAKNSQHTNGKAIDFNLGDVSMATVRDIGLRLQNGGVGYYPRANNPWVHLDTGGVRHWPKVSRDHLVRLFPDEKTVHIPNDGKPLAGFEAARSIIEARGGAVSSGYIDIAEGRATGRTLFQILFGGGDNEEEDVGPARGGKGRTAVAARRPSTQTRVAALPPEPSEGNALAFYSQSNTPTSSAIPETPAAQATIRARPTRPTPVAEPNDKPTPVDTKRDDLKKDDAAKQVAVASLAARPQPEATAPTDEKGRLVSIALPLRRPANLVTQGATLVTMALPLPRPANLTVVAALANPLDNGPQATDADRQDGAKVDAAKALQAAPVVASSGKLVTISLPIARPLTLSQTATGPRPAATTALAYAPTAVTSQAIIPAPLAVAPDRKELDRKGLNSLISQVAIATRAERSGPVTPSSVASIAGSRSLTGKFETTTTENGTARGFSGSAIRPLGFGLKPSQ